MIIDRCSILFLTFFLICTLTACKPEASVDYQKLKVVTTFTVLADMAQNVAGDAADVHSIIKPGADVHNYQPTPKDIIKAQEADLILYNGLNLERWFERFLQDIKDTPHLIVTEGIEPLSIYEGPYDGKPNPHAWMSPSNALIYIENIRAALTAADPENADTYNNNAARYSEKIKAIQTTLDEKLKAIPQDKRYLVTSEGAFTYLAKDFGLKEIYLWPINAEQQGTPQQVRTVIDTMREKQIPVIFSESTVSDKPARQVAKETGATYGGVLYVDSLSAADGPVPSFLDLLKITTDTIARGLEIAHKDPDQ